MRNWFCITNPWNWFKVESKAIWGVDNRYEITLRRVEQKDIMIFYATNLRAGLRRTLKNELSSEKWEEFLARLATVQKAIVGIYSVVETHYYDERDLGWLDAKGNKFPHNLPHRVKIKSSYPRSITPIPLSYASGRKLLEELVFFPDKSGTYYNILYPSMLAIPEEDYITIKNYVRAH